MKMENFIDFKDKTILITGASQGIGKATASLLHAYGARLILHASKSESINQLKATFSEDRHHFFQADFSTPNELENNFKKLSEFGLKIDGFVNCVGMRSRKPINLLKPDHTTEVLNTNVNSFLEMVRLVTKKGNFNLGLSIVSISSISSVVGGPGIAVYAASKAAVDAAIRCLAKELHKKEIRINSIISGQINTEAYQDLMSSKTDGIDPVLERQYVGLGQTEDIANLILFLLSDKSKFITGTAVNADGGFLN
jgi:NAD(P)-dependent dehydrogenase (short-subunit alcohol dehydrogenase family)